MRAVNTTTSWGWVARVIHWVMAGLILFQLGLGVYMTNFVDDLVAQFNLTQLHKSWGAVIFALAIVRVAWRIVQPATPELPPGLPSWQVHASHVSHALLYLLIFVLPVSGWVMSAASPNQDLLNIDNMVFDWFAMPDPWVPGVAWIADTAAAVHFAAALLLASLLAMHVAAALKHHFVDRDAVLVRMTFGR